MMFGYCIFDDAFDTVLIKCLGIALIDEFLLHALSIGNDNCMY